MREPDQLIATGRLGSSEPNLQTISVRDEEDPKIREAFATKHAMASLFAMNYGGMFNVTGTQTGRVRRNQCVKCQTKLMPGRNGRMCKKCQKEQQ